VLIRFCLLYLETRQNNWVKRTLHLKRISSLTIFIEEFLKYWALRTKRHEDILHNLIVALQREGFFSNPVEDEEFIQEQEVEEDIHE
jgi:hypothetical protein